MEALVAASVAALTVYDMAKAIDKEMVIDARAAAREDEGAGVKAAVLTVSDGVSDGTREDRSGDLLEELLAGEGFEVERRVVPDERTRSPTRSSSSPARPSSCSPRAAPASARAT